MSDPVQIAADEIRQCLDEASLRDWVAEQRWYASKSRAVTGIEVVEGISLTDELYLALVQTRFATGTHELYQLPLTLRSADGMPAPQHRIAATSEWAVYDALAEPAELVELVARMEAGSEIDAAEGNFSFNRVEGMPAIGREASVRPVGVEQSNSSLIIDERIVLKVFRKLEPGINPELEMLRFLTAHGFPNIASLYGWYEYDGQALAATLGVAQRFLPEAEGGWELALREIAGAPESFLRRLGSLGEVTARMHNCLATDASDPAFAPEEPSQEAISLLTATVDEDIERIFVRLPDNDERLAPIVGRGQDVRERLAARAQAGAGGRVIRVHGDYHLGQTLATPGGWVVIDFEGEPARPLPERRQKRSPLRDVAGMLRSFAYAASAVELQGQAPAADFELRARDSFLEQYFAHIDGSLMPAGEAAIINLLTIFELEKAIYELGYELDNRPDWVPIPVAGIRRLLEVG
jgi:trehalose synthase-fused probable maltokinase